MPRQIEERRPIEEGWMRGSFGSWRRSLFVVADWPWPGMAKGAIFAFVLLTTPMADLATAQDRPGPAAELAAGWVGFADDGIVSESLVGGAARWSLLRRVSVGPELAYIHGANHSHLVVTGNVTWDVRAPTNRRPHRVTPFLVAGGGVPRALLRWHLHVKRRGVYCGRRCAGVRRRSRHGRP
jgi:hypothetical protein